MVRARARVRVRVGARVRLRLGRVRVFYIPFVFLCIVPPSNFQKKNLCYLCTK